MSRVLRQAGAPGPVSLPRWKGSSRAGSGQAGKRQVVLVGWLASLLGGLSPLVAPPVLLVGALGLFAAAPAEAQVTLLSGTLTVDKEGIYFGCDNGDADHDNCSTATVLTDDDFVYKGVNYSISAIFWQSNQDSLIVSFRKSGSGIWSTQAKAELASLTLNVQGNAFPIKDADTPFGGGIRWSYNPATDWTDNLEVSVSLTESVPPNYTGVELESANFVPDSEGYYDLIVPEDGSTTFGVRLLHAHAAAENMTVNLMKLVAQQFHGNWNAVTVSPETLTFTPTNYNTFQTVTVTGVADDDNDHEHVIVAAQIAGGKYLADGVYVTVTDDGGAVQVGVQPATGREAGNGQASNVPVTFWLSRPAPSQGVSVFYETIDGTATDGSDYTGVFIAEVEFAAGETRKTVNIPILDDNVEDSGEFFWVRLDAPAGATIAPGYGRARVQILNDEAHLDGLTVEGAASIDGPFTALDMGGFAAETTDYAVTVPHGTTHARLAPTTADEDLTLSAGSGTELTRVRSGEAGPAMALEVGENVLVVKVVAGTDVEETYRVTVTRQQSTGTTTTDTPTTSSSDTTTTSGSDDPSPTGSGPDGETLLVAFGEIAQTLPEVSITALDGAAPISEGEEARFVLRATPRPSAPITVAVAIGDSGEFVSSGQPTPRMVTIGEDGTADFSVATQNDDMDEPDGAITATVTAGTGYTVSDNTAEVEVRDNDAPAVVPPTEEKRAWHVRFGRSVSQQVVDALQQRFSTSSTTPSGLQLTLAGEAVTSDTPLQENHVLLSRLLGFERVSSQELAQGSSFSFSPEGAGPRLSFWGQGAFSSFNGVEESITLTGEVTTALLGADWSRERWQAGAALSHSWGNGSYQGEADGADGRISSTLTGIFPYGRYALTPRLGVWATAGYGWGAITLNPDGDGPEYNPATTMTLGAVGMDGLLLDGGSEGVTLTTTADALFLKTTSEAVAGLESSEGNISRLRLGLEASRAFPLSNGASLSPSLEVGLRQDSGDAETGFGMDLGAGLSWSDPERGVTATVKGRTLLSHGAEDFQDQGLALSFSWQPTPSNRGASLSLSHAVGLPAEGGMAALLNPTAIELPDDANSDGEMFEARLAYGFPFYNDRLTLTPSVATALSNNSRTYSLLWSVAPYAQQAQDDPWQLSLEGERQENLSSPTVDHSLKLRFALNL